MKRNRADSRSSRRRGFTVVELCFGMVITALVLSAAAAFMLALSQHWRQSGTETTRTMYGNQTTTRLTREIRGARLIGAVRRGSLSDPAAAPAAVILWVNDTNGDGAIQGAECAMIEHDPAEKILRVYPTGQGNTTLPLEWSVFTDSSVLDNFAVGRSAQPIARGVDAAVFVAYGRESATVSPTLEFTLRVQAGSSTHNSGDQQIAMEYGTCTIRAPGRLPS